jgi:hypothetical protein
MRYIYPVLLFLFISCNTKRGSLKTMEQDFVKMTQIRLRGDMASSWYRLTSCCLLLALVAVMGASSIAVTQELPPGGTTRWEMEELEVVVTFLLFDPKDPGVALPKGLRFISLREMDAPEFQVHLKKNPEHSEWAFSFVEFVRPKTWILDGKAIIRSPAACSSGRHF